MYACGTKLAISPHNPPGLLPLPHSRTRRKRKSARTIRSPRLTDPTPSRRADKGPVPCQEPPLDPLLNAAKDPTPLRSSNKVAHSYGTLYPTSRWSPVVMASPPLAELVP